MMGEVIRVSGRAPDVGDLLREAMLSQRFADVALCCSGGQRFLAHRLVLSAASPYLQDVLLSHGESTGYSEPITIILAEFEGPELSAILGLVYTGSATIPKSRLEEFTRAAKTLRVTIPNLVAPSSTFIDDRDCTIDNNPHRLDHATNCNLDNVKIEETTSSGIDGGYIRCEQYPSYDGWMESPSWHFHSGCLKSDYQRYDDWIIGKNDNNARTRNRDRDNSKSLRFHGNYVEAGSDFNEGDEKNRYEDERIAMKNLERIEFSNDKINDDRYRDPEAFGRILDHPETLKNRYHDDLSRFSPTKRRENFAPNDSETDYFVSRTIDSGQTYRDDRESKDRGDHDFEGCPVNETIATSSSSRTTGIVTFDKREYDLSTNVENSASTIVNDNNNAKIVNGNIVTSTVTSERLVTFDNSNQRRDNNRDNCDEICCEWRQPRRHVANRVPASPWCQMARPAHHSPKTRTNVTQNRNDTIENPVQRDWSELLSPLERHPSTFSPASTIRPENPSNLSLNLGNVINDPPGSIQPSYGFKVPKATDLTSMSEENSCWLENPRVPRYYDRSHAKSSIFPPIVISSVDQYHNKMESNERSMNESRVDVPHDEKRTIDRAPSVIVNNDLSQHTIKHNATNKRSILNDTTCNLQTTTRIELSHPISRLCDTVSKNDEIINKSEPLLMENDRSTIPPMIEISAMKKLQEDPSNFREKSIFAISGVIAQSDDNNNTEARIDDVVGDSRNFEETPKDENEGIQANDVGSNEEHKCEQCGKIFVTRASLKVHGRTHSGEKPFRCNDCGKEFSQLRNYKYHRSVHEGTREFAATCPECGKYFNDRGYLSSHMKIHRNRKEYACNECGKSFNQRVAYNMHVRIHTGLKPHQCDQCGKAFSRKMLLKQHLRTHSGERPYQCQICHKAFADRSNMTLHTRLHSGLKPYQCTLCSKAFTKKHHLKTHLNYHTGTKPYSCPNCSLRFSQSSNMRTHYKKCSSNIVGPQNQSSTRLNDEKTDAAPSGGIVHSNLGKAPSSGVRNNSSALTPPSSDQESSILTPITIVDNENSTKIPDA